MEKGHWVRILISFIAALAVYALPLGLTGAPHKMLFVMVFVALLWITEAAPLHATAILAAFLLISIVGISPSVVFAPYFDPLIVLLLGGFVISVAINKYGLDEYIAYKIISRAGTSPKRVVLALMATSALVSMWISNSATAAIIMPIALVVLAKNKEKLGTSNFGKAAVLGVGYGATIGGIGTIIGSTPNIISAKFLNDAGIAFGFYEWLYRGLPFMLVFLLLGWAVLVAIFRPEKRMVINLKHTQKMTGDQKKVLSIFLLTVVLWITESVHGVHNSTVSLVPIILYYFSGLLTTDDFLKVDWPTLILVGGGLALGVGIHTTTLDTAIASVLSKAVFGQDIFTLFILLGVFGVLLTIFISNTTAAAVYLPIVVALASSLGAGITNTVVIAAIGVSLDFIFPFGTPPTAIAYGTKYVNMRDIAKAGTAISFIGIITLALAGMVW